MGEAALWGAIGASSLVVGAEVAFGFNLSRRVIGLVMAFGVGALISSVTFELVEESLVEIEPWQVGIGLGAGALAFFLGDRWVAGLGGAGRKNAEGSSEDGGNSGLGIAFGTLLDGIPESAVLGMSLVGGGSVSLPLLVGIWVSNLPEALGSSANMERSGWSKGRIRLLWWGILVRIRGGGGDRLRSLGCQFVAHRWARPGLRRRCLADDDRRRDGARGLRPRIHLRRTRNGCRVRPRRLADDLRLAGSRPTKPVADCRCRIGSRPHCAGQRYS